MYGVILHHLGPARGHFQWQKPLRGMVYGMGFTMVYHGLWHIPQWLISQQYIHSIAGQYQHQLVEIPWSFEILSISGRHHHHFSGTGQKDQASSEVAILWVWYERSNSGFSLKLLMKMSIGERHMTGSIYSWIHKTGFAIFNGKLLWFPVNFPLNQSIVLLILQSCLPLRHLRFQEVARVSSALAWSSSGNGRFDRLTQWFVSLGEAKTAILSKHAITCH